MRTIEDLFRLEGRIWVLLGDRDTAKLFFRMAEAEGFTSPDGGPPAEGCRSNVAALRRDRTVGDPRQAGYAAFFRPGRVTVIGEPIARVDFGKYVSGAADYLLDPLPAVPRTSFGEHARRILSREDGDE